MNAPVPGHRHFGQAGPCRCPDDCDCKRGTWPDGKPVTPWADPWHDVAGDIRSLLRQQGGQL